MDHGRFDALARALGGASSRRSALAALAGLVAGGAALDAEARRKRRGTDRDDAPRTAGKRRNKKRCKPECTGNFSCVRQQCVCETVTCGTACCAAGQACQRGRCVGAGETFCHDLGEACGDGTPCCDGLECGSGFSGGPVTCRPAPGEECASDDECLYGHRCTDGICVIDEPAPGEPSCTPTTCAAAGASCGSIPDGCDGTLDCGTCPGGQACGGAGTPNACGCAPITCTGGTQDPDTCACSCPNGGTACGGTCRSLQTDSANCGACDNACNSALSCAAGTCAYTVPAHVASFGTQSQTNLTATDGQMYSPGGLTVNAAGTVAWVSDAGNARIVVWRKNATSGAWEHTESFGSQGGVTSPTDGVISSPWQIAVDAAGATAWIADSNSSRVTVWTGSGGVWTHVDSLGSYGVSGLGQNDHKLFFTSGVAVDPAGTTAWIVDKGNGRVVTWTKSGTTWSHVASYGAKSVQSTVLSQSDGTFNTPHAIFVDAAGSTAWITDMNNHRVVVWTKSGPTWSHVASFGSEGTTGLGQADGKMKTPKWVTVDPAGTTAWIADEGNSRIVVWTKQSDGSWSHVASFGSQGTQPGTSQTDGKLSIPRGVVFDGTGTRFWIADTGNGRVTIWERP